VNINTIDAFPNMHSSFDLSKERTHKSIMKQASHLITETGEMAEREAAHLEGVYDKANE